MEATSNVSEVVTPNSTSATSAPIPEAKPKPARKRARKALVPFMVVDAVKHAIKPSYKGLSVQNIGDMVTRTVDGKKTSVPAKSMVIKPLKLGDFTGSDAEKKVKLARAQKQQDDLAEEALTKARANGYRNTRLAVSQTGALSGQWRPATAQDALLKASASTGIPYEVLVKAKKAAEKAAKLAVELKPSE